MIFSKRGLKFEGVLLIVATPPYLASIVENKTQFSFAKEPYKRDDIL